MIALGLFVIDTNSTHLLHQVVWPAVIVLGFYLVTRAPLATALIVAALAILHADSASTLLAPRIIYPAAALLALSLCVVILTRRFRHRIRATHNARWSNRSKADNADQDQGSS